METPGRLIAFLWARIPRWAPAATIFFIAMATYCVPPLLRGDLGRVPEVGDGPDYENLGLELSRGHGFSLDWGDPEFRRPYIEANTDGSYDYILKRRFASLTAYRPPFFPLVIAATYRVVGREFAAVRCVNAAAMAAACALAGTLVFRRFGLLSALVFLVLFLALDLRTRWFACAFYTESCATLCAVLMAAALLKFLEQRTAAKDPRRFRWAAVAGAATGLAILVRSSFIVWFPLLTILVYVWADSGWRAWLGRARWGSALAFLAAGCALPLPWWVRNVVVLQSPMPFGTQGDMELYSAYSDAAVAHRGAWFPEKPFLTQAGAQGVQGIEREKLIARYAKAQAWTWIQDHPLEVPRLMVWKAYDLWFGPYNEQTALLLALVAVGLATQVSAAERTVCLAMLFLDTLMVSLTWSCGGRFLVPVLPIVHACAAAGLGTLTSRLTGWCINTTP